jgi:hypothetical protein
MQLHIALLRVNKLLFRNVKSDEHRVTVTVMGVVRTATIKANF